MKGAMIALSLRSCWPARATTTAPVGDEPRIAGHRYHLRMAPSGKRTRRLTISGTTYLWSLRHTHRALDDGTREDCCEALPIRSLDSRGGLRIQFRNGPTDSSRTAIRSRPGQSEPATAGP